MNSSIENGSDVRLEYTLTDEAGNVLDSNKGQAPLRYTQGEGQLVPGLESALHGMRAGEEKRVIVSPEEGYGPADPSARAEVPKEAVPPGALTPGAELAARTQEGDVRLIRIQEVKDATVVLDLNHPLAGKTLHFEIKVLGVERRGR